MPENIEAVAPSATNESMLGASPASALKPRVKKFLLSTSTGNVSKSCVKAKAGAFCAPSKKGNVMPAIGSIVITIRSAQKKRLQ